jgi:hypothetical protein
MSAPLATVPVGVLVERSKSMNQWADYYWRAVGVLAGQPETPAWTKLSDDGERATFYAGNADIELYRTERQHTIAAISNPARPLYGSRCVRLTESRLSLLRW